MELAESGINMAKSSGGSIAKGPGGVRAYANAADRRSLLSLSTSVLQSQRRAIREQLLTPRSDAERYVFNTWINDITTELNSRRKKG